MNPRWEDVRGKRVAISMPHSTLPACIGAAGGMEFSGEGAEVALDPTEKTPAIGSFPLGRSSERKGLANRLLRGEILVTPFNLSVLQLRMTHSRS